MLRMLQVYILHLVTWRNHTDELNSCRKRFVVDGLIGSVYTLEDDLAMSWLG